MLRVNDIYPTIQGEGVNTGLPVVLIRLHGCSVGCPWCDTKETWQARPEFKSPNLPLVKMIKEEWSEMSEAEIAERARDLGGNIGAAMVTGGEPAEQDLTCLTKALWKASFAPILETSGTALGFIKGNWSWVTISPKLNMPGGKPVLDAALTHADELKLVIGKEEDLETYSEWLKRRRSILKPSCVISLQPVSQSVKATDLCVKACLAEGWRLSVQIHKFIHIQ